MHKRKSFRFFCLLLASLNVAACSSSRTDSDSLRTDSSPMAPYLNALFGTGLDPVENQRIEAELEQERQEVVAQCMKEAGFEYFVELHESSSPVVYGTNDREWISVHGYGWADSEIRSAETRAEMESIISPNEEYWESLSETEKIAYGLAMSPPIYGDDGNQIGGGGCNGLGWETINAKRPTILIYGEFAPLFESWTDFNLELNSNDDMRLVDLDWANCMADAGHPGYNQQLDARLDFVNINARDFNQKWNSRSEDRYTSSEFENLRNLEISLALADYDCQIATNYMSRSNAIRNQAESLFVNDHRTELESLLSAVAQFG